MEMLQRFQNKYLRIIVDASWYVTNDITILMYHTVETRLKGSARDVSITILKQLSTLKNHNYYNLTNKIQ